MNDHLSEFEDIPYRRSLPVKLVIALFASSVVAVFLMVEKEIHHPGLVATNGFVFVGSVVSLVLLHVNKTRREFRVDTTILTASSFVNGLLLLILLYTL